MIDTNVEQEQVDRYRTPMTQNLWANENHFRATSLSVHKVQRRKFLFRKQNSIRFVRRK